MPPADPTRANTAVGFSGESIHTPCPIAGTATTANKRTTTAIVESFMIWGHLRGSTSQTYPTPGCDVNAHLRFFRHPRSSLRSNRFSRPPASGPPPSLRTALRGWVAADAISPPHGRSDFFWIGVLNRSSKRIQFREHPHDLHDNVQRGLACSQSPQETHQ